MTINKADNPYIVFDLDDTLFQEVDYLNGMTYTGAHSAPTNLTPDPIQAMASNEGTDTVNELSPLSWTGRGHQGFVVPN